MLAKRVTDSQLSTDWNVSVTCKTTVLNANCRKQYVSLSPRKLPNNVQLKVWETCNNCWKLLQFVRSQMQLGTNWFGQQENLARFQMQKLIWRSQPPALWSRWRPSWSYGSVCRDLEFGSGEFGWQNVCVTAYSAIIIAETARQMLLSAVGKKWLIIIARCRTCSLYV